MKVYSRKYRVCPICKGAGFYLKEKALIKDIRTKYYECCGYCDGYGIVYLKRAKRIQKAIDYDRRNCGQGESCSFTVSFAA